MRIHHWSLAVALAVLSAAAFAACNTENVPPPATPEPVTSAPASAAAPAASAEPAPDPTPPPATSTPAPVASATPPEQPAERMTAPLVLRLQGPDPVPAGGDIKLQLDIVTNEPFKVPVALKVALPKGATLTSGKAEESLQLPTAGTTRREYVVHTTATLNAPVVVTADTRVDGKAGLHAERKYPDPAKSVPPSTTSPKPPVPRPSAPPK